MEEMLPELTEKDIALQKIGQLARSFVMKDAERRNAYARVSPIMRRRYGEKTGWSWDIVNTPIRDFEGKLCSSEVQVSVSGTKVASIFVEKSGTPHLFYYPCNTLSSKEMAHTIREALESPL